MGEDAASRRSRSRVGTVGIFALVVRCRWAWRRRGVARRIVGAVLQTGGAPVRLVRRSSGRLVRYKANTVDPSHANRETRETDVPC